MNRHVMTAAVVAMGLAALPASAATRFETTLSGANETTPNPSTATGFGTLVLSDDQNSLQVDIDWQGLTGPVTIGHAHCCALQGANGPVAIDFLPPALATGSLSRLYNLTLVETYSGGFLNANGGTAESARSAFLAGLQSGRVYYNLHTATYPGGEIRGNLSMVPEPAAWALMIGGFGLVGSAMRTRRATVVAA